MEELATVPAAVRKLADHFNGELPPVIPRRTRNSDGVDRSARSGEIDGGPFAFSGICWKNKWNRLHSALCLLQAERSHTDQYKRKTILFQCRRHLLCRWASRVFSLKSQQPFAKRNQPPSGRTGRDQHIYAENAAKRLNATKTIMIPTATGVKPLSKKDGHKTPEKREEVRRIPYRKAVGALMWAATTTRPDLSFAAHNLAKFLAVKALRYFWRTKDLGITYGGVISRGMAGSAYVDSDHATCPDSRWENNAGWWRD